MKSAEFVAPEAPEADPYLRLAESIEALLARFEDRALAEQLLRSIVTLYGEGLRRIFAAVEAASDSHAAIERLAADPLVASLLAVHDLHPHPLRDRIERALDEARPYIASHGGKVELLGVEAGVVHLRMSGTCDGCPASSATMKLSIERRIRALAPEIVEVRAV